MSRRFAALVTSVAIAGLTLPATARGDTATIGSDLTQNSNSNTCTFPCLAVQQTQAGGPNPLLSPANAVVTAWAIRSTDNVTYAFRVLRPAGPNTYTGGGTSLGVDPSGPGSPILTFPTSIPIRQGDAIGIATVAGDSDAGVPQHDTPGIAANVWATNPLGQPAEGATASFTPQAEHELLLQATIQFCNVPSLKRLKTKPAKRTLRAHDCLPKIKKSAIKKNRFRGKVLKQKTPPGTTAAPGTVVPIVIGKKT
jgi:hypothetical protein